MPVLLAKWLLAASALWAIVGLAWQAGVSMRGRRRPRAAEAGSGAAGMWYGFTGAMLPGRKESVSRHPVSFAAGILLHFGILVSLATALASAALPAALHALHAPSLILSIAGAVACAALLVRRLLHPDVRVLSVPDDYLSSLLIGSLLLATIAFETGVLPAIALWILAAILLLYVPLGKLRHAVFFFLARGDLGWRLGLRGVYPPARAQGRSHGGR